MLFGNEFTLWRANDINLEMQDIYCNPTAIAEHPHVSDYAKWTPGLAKFASNTLWNITMFDEFRQRGMYCSCPKVTFYIPLLTSLLIADHDKTFCG